MPISNDELRLELAKAACVIATQCALELSARDLLSRQGSQAIEQTLRDVAQIAMRAGGQVAETVFLDAAQKIQRNRDT